MFDSLAPSEIVAKLIGIGARRGSALLERSTPPSFSAIAAAWAFTFFSESNLSARVQAVVTLALVPVTTSSL